ncbi:hypothetical protein ACLOJK_034335 [Asimina triloba]
MEASWDLSLPISEFLNIFPHGEEATRLGDVRSGLSQMPSPPCSPLIVLLMAAYFSTVDGCLFAEEIGRLLVAEN